MFSDDLFSSKVRSDFEIFLLKTSIILDVDAFPCDEELPTSDIMQIF